MRSGKRTFRNAALTVDSVRIQNDQCRFVSVEAAPPPGPLRPPNTAQFFYQHQDDQQRGQNQSSVDSADGATFVKSNIPLPPPAHGQDWNIQLSDEQADSNSRMVNPSRPTGIAGSAREHELFVESPKPKSLQPAFEGNVEYSRGGDKLPLQEELMRRISVLVFDNELEPGTSSNPSRKWNSVQCLFHRPGVLQPVAGRFHTFFRSMLESWSSQSFMTCTETVTPISKRLSP